MRTKPIYIVIALCMAFTGFSCTDDQKEEMPGLLGKWDYQSPHIKWEYPADSVKIIIPNAPPLSFSVKEMTGMLTGMAAQYMGLYFKDINFTSASDLKIGMLKVGNQDYLGAIYKQDSRFLSVQLDTLQLKQMTGLSMPIPPISFTYKVENDILSVYLEKQEIATIIAAMGKMVDGLLITYLSNIPGFPEIPAQAISAIAASIKAQALKIINDSTIEIGFNLKKTQ